MHDDGLRTLLTALGPKARDSLRRVLIHDQADRDVVALQLLRYRDGRGDNWADIIDSLTLHPDARRSVDERVSSLPLQCHRLPDTGGSREERLQLAHLQACFHFTDYLTTLHRLDRAETRSEAKGSSQGLPSSSAASPQTTVV
jgi:hypothetical protein